MVASYCKSVAIQQNDFLKELKGGIKMNQTKINDKETVINFCFNF